MTAAELTSEHIGKAIEVYLKILNGECELVPVVPKKRKEYARHKLSSAYDNPRLRFPARKKA